MVYSPNFAIKQKSPVGEYGSFMDQVAYQSIVNAFGFQILERTVGYI